jgi:hypothetical protein
VCNRGETELAVCPKTSSHWSPQTIDLWRVKSGWKTRPQTPDGVEKVICHVSGPLPRTKNQWVGCMLNERKRDLPEFFNTITSLWAGSTVLEGVTPGPILRDVGRLLDFPFAERS